MVEQHGSAGGDIGSGDRRRTDIARAPSASLSRVGLVLHPQRDTRPLVDEIARWVRECSLNLHGLERDDALLPAKVARVTESEFAASSDLVIALGGDGTFLGAVRLVEERRVPVLGVNQGRLGFLTEVDPAHLAESLGCIRRGEYFLEDRSALVVHVSEGMPELVGRSAYNDLVLARGAGRGPVAAAVEVEGELFATYVGDAIVVATATGSTAYSFSAGGPIVSPRLDGMVVTPVAPHATFNRAVIVHPDERLRLRVFPQSAPVIVEMDGRATSEHAPPLTIELSCASSRARVVRLHRTNFYGLARAKLQLMDPLESDVRAR